jgi:hypothetical protein
MEGGITLDGRLDDEAWSAAEWTDDFVDILGPDGQEPRFRTRVKMLWDDECFYVCAEMEEPHVWATLRERDSVIYHDNDFEVFIDPDGDTHEYYELEVNAFGTEWDLLLIRPYRDGGPAVNAWDIHGLRTAVSIDGTLNDPGDTDGGWSIEIALPWTVLAECAHRDAPPRSGDAWRVNFSRVEWRVDVAGDAYVKAVDPGTGRPFPEDNWVWSPQGLVNMHYPEMWGIVTFADGVDVVAVDDDGVEAAWALRRVYYAERNWRAKHGSYTAALHAFEPGIDVENLELSAGADWFVAKLLLPDGRVLLICEDGRIR